MKYVENNLFYDEIKKEIKNSKILQLFKDPTIIIFIWNLLIPVVSKKYCTFNRKNMFQSFSRYNIIYSTYDNGS